MSVIELKAQFFDLLAQQERYNAIVRQLEQQKQQLVQKIVQEERAEAEEKAKPKEKK